MAARLNRNHAEAVRQKIQVSQLIKRLQDHAFGKVEMSKTQVQAASFLINKVTPNPPEEKHHTHAGPDGSPVAIEFHVVDHRPKATD